LSGACIDSVVFQRKAVADPAALSAELAKPVSGRPAESLVRDYMFNAKDQNLAAAKKIKEVCD
jgi:hypothetical protein